MTFMFINGASLERCILFENTCSFVFFHQNVYGTIGESNLSVASTVTTINSVDREIR
jgi:hypothetical protein